MRKEFMEPEVEVVDFEVSEVEGIATASENDVPFKDEWLED